MVSQATTIIDSHGFRLNVGIILTNQKDQVLVCNRAGYEKAWQFPQGGIHENETLTEAMYRELSEELGLLPENVEIIAQTPGWVSYRLPRKLWRYDQSPLCIGQKQKWFLLRLIAPDSKISLHHSDKPEFDIWKWVDWEYPIHQVVIFKRTVYRFILKYFRKFLLEE